MIGYAGHQKLSRICGDRGSDASATFGPSMHQQVVVRVEFEADHLETRALSAPDTPMLPISGCLPSPREEVQNFTNNTPQAVAMIKEAKLRLKILTDSLIELQQVEALTVKLTRIVNQPQRTQVTARRRCPFFQ